VATPNHRPRFGENTGGAIDLAILKLRVRAGLDTDRIAALYPIAHGISPACGGADRSMKSCRPGGARVSLEPGLRNVSADASVFASTYWLESSDGFSGEYAAAAPRRRARALLARVGSSAGRHVLGRFEPDIHEAAVDNRMTAIVDAYNRAADKALDEIATGTAKP